MNALKKLSNFFGQNMAVIVIAVAALALLAPGSVSFIKTSYVNTLLGIVMFGMGLTLRPGDFKVVFSRPKDVVLGCIAQFTIMPLLAFLLTRLFRLSPELVIGVILVGTCPGGTSSNVMTYLSKGDVPLSVGMTAVSTVLAPFLTPLLTYVYAGAKVDVNMASMFLSIIKVVIVPIAAGFIINHFFSRFTQNVVEILPLISTTAIVAIVAAVVSANSSKIMTSGLLCCHPAQCPGLLPGILHRKALKAGFQQMQGHLHRSGDAELRSCHFPGSHPFCPVSPGNHTGRRVQRMAQYIRRSPCQHLCPYRRTGRAGPIFRCI